MTLDKESVDQKAEAVMFQKGDFAACGSKGICEIKNITTLNMDGIPKDRLYYEMQPVLNAGSRVFTPVGQESGGREMRRILNADEAARLLSSMQEEEIAWEADDRRREEQYRRIINENRTAGMLSLIRYVHAKERTRALKGRRLPSMDARYLKTAEEHFYTELSISMKVSVEEIREYVESRMRLPEGMLRSL